MVDPHGLAGKFCLLLCPLDFSDSAPLQFIPSVAILLGLKWMPESPRWLIEVGRDEEAIESIRSLRGDAVDARAEVAEIRSGEYYSDRMNPDRG